MFAFLVILAGCGSNEPPALNDQEREWIAEANSALRQGALLRALALADSLEGSVPGSIDAQFLRGRIAYELGNLEEAEEAFLSVMEQTPSYPGAHLNMGNALFAQRRFREALPHFISENELREDPRAWHAISGVYFELGNIDSALVAAKQSARLDSAYRPAMVSLASYSSQIGAFEEALVFSRKAYGLDSTGSDILLQRARLENQAGDPEQAARLLTRLINTEPWNYSAVFELGRSYQVLGREDLSAAAFEHADRLRQQMQPVELLERRVAAAPADFSGRIELAESYRAQGRLTDALRHFLAAVRLRPDNLDLVSNLGTLYAQLGNGTEALARYRQVLSSDPDHVLTLLNVAVYFLEEGDVQKSKAFLDRAAKLEPDHPLLGRIRAALGE
ncbi:MAG: tetratricopeptide repeat protein [Bacteroidetes bacterium]|nr:tetratricopeptide repeat protein [Bacteroidota bacterium]MDA1334040.1 tetratricopeptide repeat protein [Bacteroidota bacterium]